METKSKVSLEIVVLITIFSFLFLFYSYANADCEQEYYDSEGDPGYRDEVYLDCKEDEEIESKMEKEDERYFLEENLEFDFEEKILS